MVTRFSGLWAAAFALLAALAPGACAEDAAVQDDRLKAAADSLIAGDPALSMSDPQILGFLALVNEAEVEAGQLAQEKGTDPRVREFARRMVSEHRSMLQQDERLAGQVKVIPEDPPRDYLATMHRETMSELQQLERGPAFDSAYVASQVEAHRAVLDELRLVSATSARITEHLRTATEAVEAHLRRAEQLQGQLRGEGGASRGG